MVEDYLVRYDGNLFVLNGLYDMALTGHENLRGRKGEQFAKALFDVLPQLGFTYVVYDLGQNYHDGLHLVALQNCSLNLVVATSEKSTANEMERAVRDLRDAVHASEVRFRLVLNKWDDRLGIDARELVERIGLPEFGRIPYGPRSQSRSLAQSLQADGAGQTQRGLQRHHCHAVRHLPPHRNVLGTPRRRKTQTRDQSVWEEALTCLASKTQPARLRLIDDATSLVAARSAQLQQHALASHDLEREVRQMLADRLKPEVSGIRDRGTWKLARRTSASEVETEARAVVDADAAARRGRARASHFDRPGDCARADVLDWQFGAGRLKPLFREPDVEDIVINIRPRRRAGGVDLPPSGKRREDIEITVEMLREIINRNAGMQGRALNPLTPILNATMRKGAGAGARINAVLDPVCDPHLGVTIRVHRLVARTFDDLVRLAHSAAPAAAWLWLCVQSGLSTVVGGGTSSGKTNLLNAIASVMPGSSALRRDRGHARARTQLCADKVYLLTVQLPMARASPSASWWQMRCACARTASCWARCAMARRGMRSKPATPATKARCSRCMPTMRPVCWCGWRNCAAKRPRLRTCPSACCARSSRLPFSAWSFWSGAASPMARIGALSHRSPRSLAWSTTA